MANNDSKVLYLEADEDITSAIDKLKKAEGDSIQVVTAKRSTLFQSVINLKLIQKAAKDNKKDLVLVTNDRVATNLAGRLGVPIASQVGETPQIPVAGAASKVSNDDEIDGGTVGEATPAAAAAAKSSTPLDTPTEKPAAPQPSSSSDAARAAAATPSSPKKPKGKRIPNIGSMQKRLLWVGLAVLAILLLFGLNYYFTKARVTLHAKAEQVNAQFQFSADPGAQESDIDGGVLAARKISNNKSLNAPVQATGTKDKGSKASGQMTIYNEYDSNPHRLVAGTRFVGPGGLVFRSTEDATVPGGGLSGGKIVPGKTTVPVQADQNGDQYNLGPARYSIPGLGGNDSIYGQGSQMQGGTTKTVKVITQADADKARQAALDAEKDDVLNDLRGEADKGQYVIEASFFQDVTSANSNPGVGEEAQTATMTVQVTNSVLAVQKSALSDLAKSEEAEQLGGDKQIYDDGSDQMQITASGKPTAEGEQKFSAKATAYAGEKIDTEALTKEIKGKKYGEAMDIATRVPGVERADIKITPTWATKMPGIQKHIKIEIKASTGGD